MTKQSELILEESLLKASVVKDICVNYGKMTYKGIVL